MVACRAWSDEETREGSGLAIGGTRWKEIAKQASASPLKDRRAPVGCSTTVVPYKP